MYIFLIVGTAAVLGGDYYFCNYCNYPPFDFIMLSVNRNFVMLVENIVVWVIVKELLVRIMVVTLVGNIVRNVVKELEVERKLVINIIIVLNSCFAHTFLTIFLLKLH